MTTTETVPIGPCAARAIALARQLYHLNGDIDDLMVDALEAGASTDGVVEQETLQALRLAETKVWGMVRIYLECEKVEGYGGLGMDDDT